MTQQELDRYTFRAPGQATTYLCGYLRMMELRIDTELKLGKKFNQLEINMSKAIDFGLCNNKKNVYMLFF